MEVVGLPLPRREKRIVGALYSAEGGKWSARSLHGDGGRVYDGCEQRRCRGGSLALGDAPKADGKFEITLRSADRIYQSAYLFGEIFKPAFRRIRDGIRRPDRRIPPIVNMRQHLSNAILEACLRLPTCGFSNSRHIGTRLIRLTWPCR